MKIWIYYSKEDDELKAFKNLDEAYWYLVINKEYIPNSDMISRDDFNKDPIGYVNDHERTLQVVKISQHNDSTITTA